MEQRFIEVVKEALEIENQPLSLLDKFREIPTWDSLALLSLISAIDDEYDVVITGEVLKKLATIGDVLDEVKKAVA